MTQRKMTPAIQSAWWELIRRSWSDEAFKKRLVEHPMVVLADEKFPIPEDTVFVVHENKPGEQHLVIPESPDSEVDLTELPTADYNASF